MQETDVLEIRGMVDGILNRWPAVGLAVGVAAMERWSPSPVTASRTSSRRRR